MNEDYELKLFSNNAAAWSQMGVRFLQLATTDIFETPSQEKLRQGVDFIQDHVTTENNDQSSVYVHCKAGRTRSATLVGCYLMDRYGLTPDEAVKLMKEKRPHILLHAGQWDALREFYATRIGKKAS